MFRVPLLLQTSLAVIHRLDPEATTELSPYGYDKDFQEPITYDTTRYDGKTVREYSRVELPAIRVPCQVETVTVERMRQLFQGNMPSSELTLVLHRTDLTNLGLLKNTGLQLHINDRVSMLESSRKPGTPTYVFSEPGLYIYEIRPASFGFGPEGFDLFLVYMHERERAA